MGARRTLEALTNLAASVIGTDHVRVAAGDLEVDNVAPLVIVEPPDAERAAAVLAWASRDNVPLVIRGGGTKSTWGPPLGDVDVMLSTRRLDAVVAHRHGDLTATVQAGAPLAHVNRALSAHRQWIPLDPPWSDTATIGGIIATNDSGPRRHRHGAPRDLIIGVTLACADGRLAKAGGIVVKNVAGYDMARLMTGSYGALALIVDATFKLAPVAASSRTVIVRADNITALGTVLSDLAAGQTAPSAVELAIPPGRLLIRFQAAERAAEQQASDVAALASRRGLESELVAGDVEAQLWQEHERRPWGRPGSVIKVSLLPARTIPLLEWLGDLHPGDWELVGRAGVGVLFLRVDAEDDDVEHCVNQLKARFKPGEAFVSVLRASHTLKRRVGAPDGGSDALPLMQTIKRQFDPAGILNPGRGPGGL